jgi:hypothetical protein
MRDQWGMSNVLKVSLQTTTAAGPDDVLHASLGSIERQLADIYG